MLERLVPAGTAVADRQVLFCTVPYGSPVSVEHLKCDTLMSVWVLTFPAPPLVGT